jgi:hypothetical protein
VKTNSVYSDDAGLKKIDVPAPVHLALYELELADSTFGLAVRTRRGDRGLNCVSVLDNTIGERSNKAARGAIEPIVQSAERLSADDRLKICKDVLRLRQRRDVSFNRRHRDRQRLGELLASNRE